MAFYPVRLLFEPTLMGYRENVNFNTISDQLIQMRAGKYLIKDIVVSGASIPLTAAIGGIYTGPNKTGIVVVPATQNYAALSAPRKFLSLTLDPTIQTNALIDRSLFFSMTTPQGSPCNADIFIFGWRL